MGPQRYLAVDATTARVPDSPFTSCRPQAVRQGRTVYRTDRPAPVGRCCATAPWVTERDRAAGLRGRDSPGTPGITPGTGAAPVLRPAS